MKIIIVHIAVMVMGIYAMNVNTNQNYVTMKISEKIQIQIEKLNDLKTKALEYEWSIYYSNIFLKNNKAPYFEDFKNEYLNRIELSESKIEEIKITLKKINYKSNLN